MPNGINLDVQSNGITCGYNSNLDEQRKKMTMADSDTEQHLRRYIYGLSDSHLYVPRPEVVISEASKKLKKEQKLTLDATTIARHLNRMEAFGLGLITHEHGLSPKIERPGLHQIYEIYNVRVLLEKECCQELADQCLKRETRLVQIKKKLAPIQAEMTRIAGEITTLNERLERRKVPADEISGEETKLFKLAEEFWELDGEFHVEIAKEAGYSYTAIFIDLIRNKLRLVDALGEQVVRQAARYCKDHQEIYDAITESRGDKKRISDAVENHLENILAFHSSPTSRAKSRSREQESSEKRKKTRGRKKRSS